MLFTVAFGSAATQVKSLKATTPPAQKQPLSDTIQTVDKMYDENKMKEALTYLERHSESKEAEVLWRLARLCFKVL